MTDHGHQKPLRIAIFLPLWGIPSASPFAVKLITWLQMAELPFEAEVPFGPPKSGNGKLPYWIRPGGEIVEDSQRIIETLTLEYGVALDDHLTAPQRAHALALRKMVEESLYFVLIWDRWLVDDHWRVVRGDYFGSLPLPLRLIAPPLLRRKVERDVAGHGMGRRSAEEIYAEGDAILESLAHWVGDAYAMGEPSSVDACVYAFLTSIAAVPYETPLRESLVERPRLTAYIDRMKNTFRLDAVKALP